MTAHSFDYDFLSLCLRTITNFLKIDDFPTGYASARSPNTFEFCSYGDNVMGLLLLENAAAMSAKIATRTTPRVEMDRSIVVES